MKWLLDPARGYLNPSLSLCFPLFSSSLFLFPPLSLIQFRTFRTHCLSFPLFSLPLSSTFYLSHLSPALSLFRLFSLTFSHLTLDDVFPLSLSLSFSFPSSFLSNPSCLFLSPSLASRDPQRRSREVEDWIEDGLDLPSEQDQSS